jgi:hypothetical protein
MAIRIVMGGHIIKTFNVKASNGEKISFVGEVLPPTDCLTERRWLASLSKAHMEITGAREKTFGG